MGAASAAPFLPAKGDTLAKPRPEPVKDTLADRDEYHPDARVAAAAADQNSRIASLKAVRQGIARLEAYKKRGSYEEMQLEDLRCRAEELVQHINDFNNDPED